MMAERIWCRLPLGHNLYPFSTTSAMCMTAKQLHARCNLYLWLLGQSLTTQILRMTTLGDQSILTGSLLHCRHAACFLLASLYSVLQLCSTTQLVSAQSGTLHKSCQRHLKWHMSAVGMFVEAVNLDHLCLLLDNGMWPGSRPDLFRLC